MKTEATIAFSHDLELTAAQLAALKRLASDYFDPGHEPTERELGNVALWALRDRLTDLAREQQRQG